MKFSKILFTHLSFCATAIFVSGCLSEPPEATNYIVIKRDPAAISRDLLASKENNSEIATANGWTIELPKIDPADVRSGAFKINPWAIAIPPKSKDRKPMSRKEAWEEVYRTFEEWEKRGVAANKGIQLAEPELVLQSTGFSKNEPATTKKQNVVDIKPDERRPRQVSVGEGPSPHWPSPKPNRLQWQLEDQYSQLRSARLRVEAAGRTNVAVQVVVLDTGARTDFDTIPERYQTDQATNLLDWPKNPDEWATHGTATTSILAGGRIQVTNDTAVLSGEFNDYVGADPWVKISTYRISSWVVSFLNVNSKLAEGIRLAVDRKADVISISNGGVPSFEWADQVNYAYTNGTAIFAASGDYINLFNMLESPRRVVYPAAFSRVICVPGVTYDYNSYGEIPNYWSFFHLSDWSTYFMRGSYGPSFMMGNAVCGFAPNVLWVGDTTNTIDLDGAGTSATTPQVAAAAALWFQFHRNDLELEKEADWRSHKKVDAVYYALKTTARKCQLKPNYSSLYFGCGTVAAADALNVSYPTNIPPDQLSYPDAQVDIFRMVAILTDWFPIVHTPEEIDKLHFTPEEKEMILETLQIAYSSKKILNALDKATGTRLTLNEIGRANLDTNLCHSISELILNSSDASSILKAKHESLRRNQTPL